MVCLICILALLVIAGCTDQADSLPVDPSKNTFEPLTISGEGDYKSEPFTIPDRQWLVEWSYTSDTPETAVFNVFIYLNRWMPYFVAALDQSPENSGSQVIHFGPGEYYIDVRPHHIESWKLTISPA